MAQVTKLHHTVPQFYLRGFADENEKIRTVVLPGTRRYTTLTKGTAATNHFYAIEGHPDGKDAFEKTLAEVEADAAGVFRTVASGTWPLEPEDRAILACFIALQSVRGPNHRRNIGQIMSQTTRVLAQFTPEAGAAAWAREYLNRDVDEAEAVQLWNDAKGLSQPFDVPAEIHIDQMVTTMFEILPFILGRPWALLNFNRRRLITGDVPVSLMENPSDGPARGAGFLTAGAITFPVSRSQGLVMTDSLQLAQMGVPIEDVREGKTDTAVDGTTAYAKMLNSNTIRFAHQYLYLHPDDEGVLPDTLPNPRVTSIHVSGQPDGR